MTPIIKFPTLENKEICIKFEDAAYIGFESRTVASILTGSLKEEDCNDQRFGGKAINFALEFCKKFGKIKSCCSLWLGFKPDANATSNLEYYYSLGGSLDFEMECKKADVDAWVDDFIVRITENGIGMVHELLTASEFLLAFRLSDLVCQYIFGCLAFEHYGEFRKTFGFPFLFPAYGCGKRTRIMDHVLEDILQLPTSKDIYDKFHAEFPFTSDELNLAEVENKSMRVGGNLEYNNEDRLVKELFIKIEYLVRRLSSLQSLSFWMENALSKCFTESISLLQEFFGNESNNDIKKLRSTFSDPALTCRQKMLDLHVTATIEMANPCISYEDIDLIKDDINKIELKMAEEANEQKAKIDKLAKSCLEAWQIGKSHHKDKVLPHLIYFLEDRYHEIYCILCAVQGWTSPQEVRKWNCCNNPDDQNEDQYDDVENEVQDEVEYVESEVPDEVEYVESEVPDEVEYVESEEQNEDHCDDVESEELVSPKSTADDKIRDDVFSSLTTLDCWVDHTSRNFFRTYQCFLELEIKTRHLQHNDLLLKDDEILTFICEKKFNIYMKASEQKTSKISFAQNKHEFDMIMKETTQKFGEREPVIVEAMKKYFRHFGKFHYAMVNETEHQILLSKFVKRSRKRKSIS